ncbi:unnamed protein product [Colias eurytheme]|nr:unnamed protein product [Colias eurytheme]
MRVHDKSMVESEMHACLRHTMRLSRWAGVFCVSGLDKSTFRELRCNVKSVYFIMNIISLIVQFILMVTCMDRMTYKFNVNFITMFMFYLTTTLTTSFLLKLAWDWPKLIKKTTMIEQCFAPIRTTRNNPRKFLAVSCFVTVMAIVEHALCVNFRIQHIMLCLGETRVDAKLLQKYISETLSLIFQYTAPDLWKTILYEIFDFQASFVWNFTDVITMCASMYLSSHFRDLNGYIEKETKRGSPNWAQIRIHYSYLVKLVNVVDSKLCYLILLSYFSNVYYICNQMFFATNRFVTLADSACKQEAIIRTINSKAYKIYYLYSFFFLLHRFFMMSTFAVNVNIEALKPLKALRDVPSEEYNVEVQRFIHQLRHSITALSGVFFYITKGMILNVIGTIITYELVLLQFSRQKTVAWTDRHNHTSYFYAF